MNVTRWVWVPALSLGQITHWAQADVEGWIPAGAGSDWAPYYVNSDGVHTDDLGDAVAMNGDRFMIGEPGGDGLIANTGTAWALTWNEDSVAFDGAVDLGALVPSTDIVSGSQFGFSIDVDGDYAVVGAPTCAIEGAWSGRAYLFKDNGTAWTHVHTFTDGAAGSEFGYSVDIDGLSVAIGEPGDNDDVGYVHLYSLASGLDGTVVRPQGGLTPPRFGGRWGEALDRQGDYLIIGAPADIGFAAIYREETDGSYTFLDSLSPPADLHHNQSRFGAAVAIYDTRAIVGAPWPEALEDEHGAAVVFVMGEDDTWYPSARLDDDTTGRTDRFGESLAIFDDVAIVGIPADDPAGPGSGSAAIFRYSPTSELWAKEHHLIGFDVRQSDRYGTSVAAGPHGVGVGVPQYDTVYWDDAGAAFLYRQMPWDDDNWQHDIRAVRPCLADTQRIEMPFDTGPHASFGRDVAHDGTSAIIGDPYAVDEDGTPSGWVAFLYRSSSSSDWTTLTEKDVVLPDDIQDWAYFGASVDIDGDFAIIGSPGHNSDMGRAVVMQKGGSGWDVAVELNGFVSGSRFGWDVAVESAFGQTYFIVGAPGLHHDAGSVHIYQWDDSDLFANHIFSVSDVEWSSGATSRFGESADIHIVADDHIRLAIGNPWQFASTGTGYGAVSLYEASEFASGHWVYGNYTNLKPYVDLSALAGGFCAENIDLDDDLLIVGMQYTNAGNKYQSGAAVVYEGTDLTGDGVLNWSFDGLLTSPDSDNGDYAGFDVAIDAASHVAVLGVPGMDYAQTNAGGVIPFTLNSGEWVYEATLISRTLQPGVAVGTSVALDGTSLLAGAPSLNLAENPAHPPHVLSWEIVDRTAYQDPEGGSMGSDNAWSDGIGGTGLGLFSLWLAEPYSVLFDIEQWVGSLDVELDHIKLNLLSGTKSISGSLTIAGVTDLKSALLGLDAGTLVVQNDMTVGRPGGYGQIVVGDPSRLEVVETLDLTEDAGTTLTLDLDPEPLISAWAQAPTITGSMRVQLGSNLTDEDLTEGSRFVLIMSGVAPKSFGLDAIVLPGLGNGLAFQVTSGSTGNRAFQGECPEGQILDCFGNCCPESWVGDEYCDDGTYYYGGVPIYLNCETHDCDGGDCTGCWDDGGDWELAIEIVSLAGLLEFGDPNSLLVSGDPTALEVVDLTDDGAEEICVTFAGSPGQLYIFENDGAGGVSQQVVLATGDEPVDITSGDFDGDGRMDLAVANNLGQSVDIYYNDDNDVTDGFTMLVPSLDVGAPPTCLAGINMNFDELNDLVVGLEDIDGDGNGFWEIYLASGALRGGSMGSGGGLAPSGSPLGVDPSEEEDQKDFLWVGRTSDGKANVGKTTGAATGPIFTIDEYVVGADPGGISLSDLDGDGFTDIAVTSTTNGAVAILRGDTASPGDFQAAVQVPTGDEPTRITSVDFDEDGNLDLAAIVHEESLSSGTVEPLVRVLQNDGNLVFTSIDIADGEDVALIDTGDVSGDGTAELVTIGSGASFRGSDSSPMLSLRQLESELDCPGDADADGVVAIEDLLTVLSEFNDCTSACNGDFDGDDDVDIEDLLAVIGNWGPCRR